MALAGWVGDALLIALLTDRTRHPPPSRTEASASLAILIFACCLHAWSLSFGWESKSLPGVEYRQAQTALSAYWINRSDSFELDYPTPVLGKPWSVPMEFPLYQWTVVATSKATGLGLTKAGRAVSAACFYLSLPALFLLLGRWQVAPARRCLAIALVLTCPLYVFYSRAFLIETMALMFALWFWVAFERAVDTGSPAWTGVAVLAGIGAGLVKVTTFMLYGVPVALWSVARLWHRRRAGGVVADIGRMAAVTAVPVAVTAGWILWADRVKALNPAADFLGSAHMRDFNVGNTTLRFSPELWAMKARIVAADLTWWPVFGAISLLLIIGGRHRIGAMMGCVALFATALVVFPVLYAYHPYYYVANTVLLMLAVGLLLAGVAESSRSRWLAPGAALILVAGQWHGYEETYRSTQEALTDGTSPLTRALRQVTRADDVLIVTGQDWSSITSYFAQRRALMLRADAAVDGDKLDRMLAALGEEQIGALVIDEAAWADKTALIQRLGARGMAERPLMKAGSAWLFFPRSREEEIGQQLQLGRLSELSWAPGREPPDVSLAGRWWQWSEVPVAQRGLFRDISPAPLRFFCSFEPQLQVAAGAFSLSGHPLTRLVFSLPAGDRRLRTTLWFNPDAYRDLSPGDATDGVELRILASSPDGQEQVMATRLVSPTHRPEDRGPVEVDLPFSLAVATEVEVTIAAGPAGRDTRDWVWIRGGLRID